MGFQNKRKQSLYMPRWMLDALNAEGKRTQRSISWLVQRCIREHLHEVQALPSTAFSDDVEEREAALDRRHRHAANKQAHARATS